MGGKKIYDLIPEKVMCMGGKKIYDLIPEKVMCMGGKIMSRLSGP